MATHFHQQLDRLKLKVLEMAAYSERAAEKALRAIIERDTALAGEVVAEDHRINRMERDIDEFSLKLLALDQPMAVDLRFIVGSMRTGHQLERVGDQAVNIARRSQLLSERPPLPRNHGMEELGGLVKDMLRASIVAYNNSDMELAGRVCGQDDQADELNVRILRGQIEYMLKETPAIERSVHLILAARCLERIGDLASNIAENVVFMIQGVNHKPVQADAAERPLPGRGIGV